jgi:hypothetical protein
MATAGKKKKINLDKCWNTEDPITLDDLMDKSVDEIIIIPSSHEKKKGHCFLVESLFGWYRDHPGGAITNPLDPSRVLTDDEIDELLRKMAKINPKLVTDRMRFHWEQIALALPGHTRRFAWYHISIKYKNSYKIYDDLGVIPAFVGDKRGSSIIYMPVSSNQIIKKLDELWDTNRLMWPDTILCCRIQLKFKPEDWFDRKGNFDEDLFMALNRELDRHLGD